jgi:serine/threonine protein kinase
MIDTSCPHEEQLALFALGMLEESAAEQLVEHLRHCLKCEETQCGFDEVVDTIVLQLRQPTIAEPFVDEVEYRTALKSIAGLGNSGKFAARILNGPFAAPPVPPSHLREYRLLGQIGKGGMGTVYQAVHTRLGKTVAIKILAGSLLSNPLAISRFSREMLVIGSLDHPHLIRALDAGEIDQQQFLVMEYIDGVDLSVLSKSIGAVPIADACEIIRQAALGLEYVHQRGLVHRDVKPSNLMLTTEGQVKILDLGLALLSHGDDTAHELTSPGQIMGTVDYMAPEQGGDTHRVDIRADIYSLGATLYKLLTGDAPFADPKLTTTMQKLTLLATQEPTLIRSRRPEISEALAAVVQRMLAKNPAQRFATPAEVVVALRPFAVGANLKALSIQAERETPTVTVTPQPQDDFTVLALTDPGSALESDVKVSHQVQTQNSKGWRSMTRWLTAAGVSAVAIVAGIVLFWDTPEGTVRFEINDPEIKIAFDNARPTITQAGQKQIKLDVGPHTLKVKRGELEFDTQQFVLKNQGDEVSLKIELLAGKVQVAMGDTVLGSRPLSGNAPADRPEQPANVAVATTNVDRRAAEYALSIGGTIGFIEDGKERKITDVADLPRGPFELTLLSLNWIPKASDDGLANCKGCKNLTILDLDGTQMTDAGLINFKDCKNLTHLGLHGTKVSDAGLALFKVSRELTHLDVGGTSVSDVGLSHFKDCRNLTYLDPSCTQLTDAGLAYFKDCKNLTTLRVGGPQVTDAGLACFKDCLELTTLSVGGLQLGDAALAHFKDCKKIGGLHLNGANMTAAGLLHFNDCRIGGLYVTGSPANDAWLAHCQRWKSTLGQLSLGETQVGDAGLAHLKDGDLYVLQLCGTLVSDAGLVHLQGHKHLGGLDLIRTQVSDAGLEHLARIQSLVDLYLLGTKVTRDGVRKLQAALPKCKIVSDFSIPVPDIEAVAIDKPFVLIRGDQPVKKFKSFAGVLSELESGDEIEVHGNGPFGLPQFLLDGKGLVLRAAPGFRPRFVPTPRAAEEIRKHLQPWFKVINGPVILDGCEFDFVSLAGYLAVGEGGPWRITRCRLYRPDARNGNGLIAYSGSSLHISDCVIVTGYSYQAINLGDNVAFEFHNNLFWTAAYEHIHTSLAKGPKLQLSRNTLAGIGVAFGLPNDAAAITLTCENNVFSAYRDGSFIRSPRMNVDVDAIQAQVVWTGNRNLYDLDARIDARAAFLQCLGGKDFFTTLVAGNLADWQKVWGDRERNGLAANGPTLLYQGAWLPDHPGDPLPRLHKWVNRRLQPGHSEAESLPAPDQRSNDKPLLGEQAIAANDAQQSNVGPDWNVVGPGLGYLRALAATGQPVAVDQLRPEAVDGGPITLLRNGKPPRGYSNLIAAVADAADGDVVAIHSGGMIVGLDRRSEKQGKRITLRAGYGHRPSLDILKLSPADVWSIEGLHFTADVALISSKPAGRVLPDVSGSRLLNCSFAPDTDWQRCQGASLRILGGSADGATCEVINCILPNYLSSAARRLKIVNSAICGVDHGNIDTEWPRQFEFKQCVVYSGAHGAISALRVPVSVTATHCWFEFGNLRFGEIAQFDWQGDYNVFCHGPRNWMVTHPTYDDAIWDLSAWRSRWDSDAHSRSGDAAYVDPRFYNVLPSSPAYKAGTGGADLGADLTHFTELIPAPP